MPEMPRWRAARLVPWELGLVALAVVSYRRLGEWGVPIGRGADVTHVDLWGLLFPVLFLVATVAVTSRLLRFGLPNSPENWRRLESALAEFSEPLS